MNAGHLETNILGSEYIKKKKIDNLKKVVLYTMWDFKCRFHFISLINHSN